MSTTNTSTNTTTLPSWYSADWQNLINNANTTTQNDINSENIPGVQNQISNSTQSILGNQVDAPQLASGIAAAGQANWTNPGTAASFMDPYESTALQNQVQLATSTELDPQLASDENSAAASGALGGSRSAVKEALDTTNFNNQENNLIAQGENTAYQTGENQFNTQAAQNLAAQEAAAQTQLAGANSNIYANYAATQNAMQGITAGESPEQQEAIEAGILGSKPLEGTQSGNQTTGAGNFLGGIAGGLLGGAGSLLSSLGFAKGGIMAGAATPKRRRARRKKRK